MKITNKSNLPESIVKAGTRIGPALPASFFQRDDYNEIVRILRTDSYATAVPFERTGIGDFLRKRIEKTDSCWLWKGPLFNTGYGRTWIKSRTFAAHRLVYQILNGPLDSQFHLDHLCRNRACVNPVHLEPVSGKVNVLRGAGPAAENAKKTHCIRGHEFSKVNTYIHPTSRQRACIECRRLIKKKWRAEKRRQGIKRP